MKRILLVQSFTAPHALADDNQHIWITEKMLEFTSTISYIVSITPYLGSINIHTRLVKSRDPIHQS